MNAGEARVREQDAHRDLRVVVAGAGTMARHHLRALSTLEGARVVGVADPSPSAREEALAHTPADAAGAATLEESLGAVEADVVHVCTPMETHAPLARDALRSGCHVYVEKPVAPTGAELESVLREAEQRGLSVCAGHQVLFERPYRELLELLPVLGTPVHVESYFSFRPVRTGSDRARPLTPAEQLADVLPHPTYLLADVLERAAPDRRVGDALELPALEVVREGTAHVLARAGELTGALVVTLDGRPVEHRLRVVGTNGTVEADFVRGTVQRLLGPGSSGPEKALNPFRHAAQLGLGTTVALGRRALRRNGTYPGLRELIQAFYASIRRRAPSPTSPGQIRATVRICEAVTGELQAAGESAPEPGGPPGNREVLVTGGTGLLGRRVVARLAREGIGVRSLSRRLPSARARTEGVEYRTADLASGIPDDLLRGVHTVVHCAAETAGGWEEHRRNTVQATERLMRAASGAGVDTFVHVSSVAVQGALGNGAPIRDDDPVHPRPEELGPYAWGKAESERVAGELAEELGLRLRVVRPVPLVDAEAFDPPGRLGRRVGNTYVAVGSPRDPLTVAEASDSARAVVRVVLDPEGAPPAANLVPADPPTRGELVERLRERSPEVKVVWLPRTVLHPLSWTATALQRVMRPRGQPVRLAPAFATVRYEPGPAAAWMEEPAGSERPTAELDRAS